uniref:Uncharacterized protein n=1 Tax=Daphnia galeata TaxID=27404 RepID=A0A8J2WPS6_9CRUS|nr:unnamed protein product [Daphnia galeata]
MEHNHYLDDPLVAYKAGLAEALGCLLTAEDEGEERGSDSGAPGVVELLASTLRLHLRKQQAFNEYIQKQTSARLVAVNIRDNDDDLPQQTTTTSNTNSSSSTAIQTVTDDDDDEDLIGRRQLLIECFQGVNLHYSSSTIQQLQTPPSSPEPNTIQVGPSL